MAEQTTQPQSVRAKGEEQTPRQVLYLTRLLADRDEVLLKNLPATYETYRKIRRHPTVALARALSIAPVVASDWSVEADDDAEDDWIKLIQDDIVSLRQTLLKKAMEHRVDFGWCPWEIVYEMVETETGPRYGIRKLKHLLVDMTEITVDGETGGFTGVRQATPLASKTVDLETAYCFVLWFDEEGTNWYGYPLLENIRKTYAEWEDANAGSARYDKKIAGDHWVVWYPSGVSVLNGVSRDNSEVAREILDMLESSGHAAMPRSGPDPNNPGAPIINWDIDLKSSTGQQGNFVVRQEYCDKLFVRGLLTPERAILEALYGTRADAAAAADWTMIQRDLEHQQIVQFVNWHLVNRLLVLNYGPTAEGKVRIKAASLTEDKRAFFRTLLTGLLANPLGFADIFEGLDVDALIDAVGLPKSREVLDADPNLTDGQRELAERLSALYQKVNGGNAPAAEPAEV